MSLAASITRSVTGLSFVGTGLFFLYLEMTHPPAHTTHVFLYAVSAMLGALILNADPILDAFKKGATAAGPFIPSFGRRDYDQKRGES